MNVNGGARLMSIDWPRASRVRVMVEGIARRIDLGRETESAEAGGESSYSAR